jgi:hypothetical protein
MTIYETVSRAYTEVCINSISRENMKLSRNQKGFGALEIILLLVTATALAFVGWFVWKQNEVKPTEVKNQSQVKTDANIEDVSPDYEIKDVAGKLTKQFTHHKLGFSFRFPAVVDGQVGCEKQDTWNDEYGNRVKSPVEWYGAKNGTAPLTVLASENTFTITQEKAPMFTEATYGPSKRMYNSSCQYVTVTQDLIDGNKLNALEERSWQVYKLDNAQQIAEKALKLRWLPSGTSAEYSLGTLENGRQNVTITIKGSEEQFGGGRTVTWYYPEQKLLVHIGLGQSVAFAVPGTNGQEYYIEDIVNSFEVL